MGILTRILASPVLGPIEGVVWLARLIEQQAEAEFYDEDKVRSGLMELEQRLDLGEISTEEYDAREAALLEQLKKIREVRNG